MEPLGLTDLQRSKLEELCLAYFPEFNGMITVDRISVMFNGKNPIHWLELSVTHLLKRIFLYPDVQLSFLNITILGKVHPVDLLYEKYIEEQQAEFEENRKEL